MANTEFEIRGLCHVALVCEDMERTVDFYTNVLGMELKKTIALGNGGQHFFFDMGNDSYLAFFWFPNAPKKAPGIASAGSLPGVGGDISSAHASMNHLAFTIPLERFDEYKARLEAKGVQTGPVLNHDDSERGVAAEFHDGVFVRSMYFFDPDGVLLEFAAWTRELDENDVNLAPVNAQGIPATVGASG